MKKIVLENNKFLVTLIPLGATLTSFYVKGADRDLVLGFDDPMMYLDKRSASMGKSVGRCANRIGGARFTLDNVEYTLLANNGPNTLHGGEVRFGDREWDIKERSDTKVTFIYDSPHMESGFPGNLKVTATYEITDDTLIITYSGISDRNTIFNMTNHAYFNFDKEKSDILSHELLIPAKSVNLNDINGMAMDKTIVVDGTPFDFTSFKKVGENVSANGMELRDYCKKIYENMNESDIVGKNVFVDNIDTNYLYENMNEKVLCELKNEAIKMTVSSDLPSVQIYTGKALDVDGREGHYGSYAGIAIEPQFCPNAINYNDFIKPILKANTLVSHTIKYKVDIL